MPRTSKHDQRGGIIKCHKNVEKVQITENVAVIGGYTLKVSTLFRGTTKVPTDKEQTDKCPNLRLG